MKSEMGRRHVQSSATQEPRHALRTGSVGGPQDQAKHARSAGAKRTKQTKQNANAVAQPGRTQL